MIQALSIRGLRQNALVDFRVSDEDEDSLSVDEIDAIRCGTSLLDDGHAAELLLQGLAALMISVATGGPMIKLVEGQYQREDRALRAVLKRLEIGYPNRFTDLWRWHGYWSAHLPTYRERRSYITELFDPVRDALDGRLSQHSAGGLATDVVDAPTGWPEIDAQVNRLRRDYGIADDEHSFQSVGLLCVSILQNLGRQVFDPERDGDPGKPAPSPDDAKARIEAFMRRAAPGDRSYNARGLVRHALGQGNTVKHRRTSDALDAGVAANATILVVCIVRQFVDATLEEEAGSFNDDIPF